MANIGHPQVRGNGRVETGIVTAGNDLTEVARFLPETGLRYSAASVIARLLATAPQAEVVREEASVCV